MLISPALIDGIDKCFLKSDPMYTMEHESDIPSNGKTIAEHILASKLKLYRIRAFGIA